MSAYHMMTNWQVEADIREIWDILTHPEALSRWCPSVYIRTTIIEAGDPDTGIGRTLDLYTKGWLPYTLRWQACVTDVNEPHGYTITADGDFIGRGIWTFKQVGSVVDTTYDWKIEVTKPLLKYFTPILRPIFNANHHWAMDQAHKSLLLELKRRHAATPEQAAQIPAPPQPTFKWMMRSQ